MEALLRSLARGPELSAQTLSPTDGGQPHSGWASPVKALPNPLQEDRSMWTSHFRRVRRRWLLAPVACLVLFAGALPAVTLAQQADFTLNIIEPSASDPMSWGFDMPDQTVAAGQTIAWINTGAQAHTIIADDNSFDSGNIDPG